MNEADAKCGTSGKCCCPCHRVLGILVILFGLDFLLGALGILGPRLVSLVWPVLLILGGLKLTCKGMCKCCKEV